MIASVALTRMLAVLEEERAMLRAGDFQALSALQERKTELGTSLAQGGLSADDMRPLAASLERNARLFKAASEGVADAMATLGKLSKSLSTSVYSKDGTVSTMEPKPGKVERKA